LGFSIASGSSNGVDLAGTKLVLHGELPGDFMGGIDKALLYLDESSSPQQRDELEAIFQGKRGGVWEGVAGMIGQFLPSKTVRVEVTGGGQSSRQGWRLGRHHLESNERRGRQADGAG